MERRRTLAVGLCLVSVWALAGVARAAVPSAASPAGADDAARVLEAARVPTCVCDEQREQLARYRDAIAGAKSVDEAREKAAWPSRLARRALGLTGFLKRDAEGDKVEAIRARLASYEARVAKAESADAAAAEFDGLVRVAGDVNVGGKGGCHYDATEVIAIILGFLLFIIPGIILLIVFC
jgi:hypothetical protein